MCVVDLGLSPLPVTVTTRIKTCLVGDPYKPSFATVTGRGGATQRRSFKWEDFLLGPGGKVFLCVILWGLFFWGFTLIQHQGCNIKSRQTHSISISNLNLQLVLSMSIVLVHDHLVMFLFHDFPKKIPFAPLKKWWSNEHQVAQNVWRRHSVGPPVCAMWGLVGTNITCRCLKW